MKKRLVAFGLAIMMLFGSSMTVFAAPQQMPDGTIFDAEYYAANNPDVVAAFGTDAQIMYLHYVLYGKAEGRKALVGPAATTELDRQAAITQQLYSFQNVFPEKMPLTNESFYYEWKGGTFLGGYGCAGFAFYLSDAVFGSKEAVTIYDRNVIRPGDILRVNHDTHSVIVLKTEGDKITVAEGNYNHSVHWGRVLSRSKSDINYIMTRY